MNQRIKLVFFFKALFAVNSLLLISFFEMLGTLRYLRNKTSFSDMLLLRGELCSDLLEHVSLNFLFTHVDATRSVFFLHSLDKSTELHASVSASIARQHMCR